MATNISSNFSKNREQPGTDNQMKFLFYLLQNPFRIFPWEIQNWLISKSFCRKLIMEVQFLWNVLWLYITYQYIYNIHSNWLTLCVKMVFLNISKWVRRANLIIPYVQQISLFLVLQMYLVFTDKKGVIWLPDYLYLASKVQGIPKSRT